MSTQGTLLILGGVFALVGCPMVWLALRAFAQDRAIATWPRAPGVITSRRLASHMESYEDRDGFQRRDRVFQPIVHYRYEVDGQTLEGNRIHRHDDATTGQESAQREIDRYAVNQAVSVLYDPQDPKVSYLETRTSIGGVILGLFGAFWIALGVFLGVLSFL